MRDQRHAHDSAGEFERLGGIFRDLHAAALAAAAGVNLRLHHHAAAERFGGRLRLFHGVRHLAARHRDVVLGQDGLCLILVNFHGIAVLAYRKSIYHVASSVPDASGAEQNLSAADAEAAMQIILRGEASHPQIAAFLIALQNEGRDRGRAGGLRTRHAPAWPSRWTPASTGQTLLDTCGTGGDRREHIQHLHRRRLRGRRRGSPRRQARQSLDFQPMRQRRSAGSAGASRSTAARR